MIGHEAASPFDARLLGTATLEPATPAIAGSFGTWTLRLTVGAAGIDEGGTIKIARRYASDWEAPQFDRPSESGFCTVTTSGKAVLSPHYEYKGHVRPYMKCLVIDVSNEALKPGDEVTVVFGDVSQGSPGARAQTFQESRHELLVFIDPTNACLTRLMPNSPALSVVAGPAVKLVGVVPTRAVTGEWIEVFVRGEDAWGNPAPASATGLRWDGQGKAEIEGTKIRFSSPAEGRIAAESALGLFYSNPLSVQAEALSHGRYWGDLHAQTGTTIGTGTDDEYFTFGRDAARLDVMSHQGNDFQISDSLWKTLNETFRRYHQDGKFVVLPGYEWSANTPCGGDHNVFYREEGLPILRSSHWQVPDAVVTDLSPALPLDDFFQKLRRAVPEEKVVVAAHVGGRYADMRRPMDCRLAPLVELVSCWGIFEWMLWDSFEQGHIVGVMANSDGHKGRPGGEGPGAGEFGIANGLTCILARSLTRDGIFEALKNRRTYGTTGPRIDLDFTVDGQAMGSCLAPRDSHQVAARAVGVGPLEEVVLFAGRHPLRRLQSPEFVQLAGSPRIRVKWGGAHNRGRKRKIAWDGTIAISGNRIRQAQLVAFDSPADGIVEQDASLIRFRSQTVGDCDAFDLDLESPLQGHLVFSSKMGKYEVDLASLAQTPFYRDCGGLGAFLSVEAYPREVTTRKLEFATTLTAEEIAGRPLFVRVLQVDGHIAWSSPVYFNR